LFADVSREEELGQPVLIEDMPVIIFTRLNKKSFCLLVAEAFLY